MHVFILVLAFSACVYLVVGVAFKIRNWLNKKNDDKEQWAPRPIDANNPPRYMKYAPKPGRQPLRCTVCFHALVPGDRVLLWPKQGAAYDLLCPDCWKVQPQ